MSDAPLPTPTSDPAPLTVALPARFAMRTAMRWAALVLLCMTLGGLAFATSTPMRFGFALQSLLLGVIVWGSFRAHRVVEVHEGGYRVLVGGAERFRVGWTEVKRAQAVPDEKVLYLDTGDPARNLLVPPRYGFGYGYHNQDALYELLAARVADRTTVHAKVEELSGRVPGIK